MLLEEHAGLMDEERESDGGGGLQLLQEAVDRLGQVWEGH